MGLKGKFDYDFEEGKEEEMGKTGGAEKSGMKTRRAIQRQNTLDN